MHNSVADRYHLGNVDSATRRAIEEIVTSTFDTTLVGVGKDAKHLQYSGVRVTDVKQLKHPRLVNTYCSRRKQISRNISQSRYICRNISHFPDKLYDFKCEERHQVLNEVFLFHGTTEAAAQSIMAQGFNIQYSSHNAMFGKGIYFAEKFTKADQYTGGYFRIDS